MTLAAISPSHAPSAVLQTPPLSPLIAAGETLAKALARGQTLDWPLLRQVMQQSYGATDGTGAWVWKDAYEAAEVALVIFLRQYLPAIRRQAGDPVALHGMLTKIAALLPVHTKRSEESQAYQQFSTPPGIAALAAAAADLRPDDILLEPSAGTGLLAVFAHAAGARLVLNEFADERADVLRHLFTVPVTQYDGAHIDDYLPTDVMPTVVVMNPPFSASPHVRGPVTGADLKHLRSALQRLAPGGRLVAITSYGLHPDNPDMVAAFDAFNAIATLRFTTGLAGQHYRRHGTTIATRLTVFDKEPGDWRSSSSRPSGDAMALATTQQAMLRVLPPRTPVIGRYAPVVLPAPVERRAVQTPLSTPVAVDKTSEELDYNEAPPRTAATSDALYAPYEPERIVIPDAQPHPTTLVQSAAMASVLPPLPTYRPHLPRALVRDGHLSAPQLESVIYAGEAHSKYLPGRWLVNETRDALSAAPDDAPHAVQFRRGWFLGDGTGAGKGRQVAGIVLDNWLKGRRKALWISKSDKLLEDAQRDWSALLQEKLLVVPQSRFAQGKPIRLAQGILFTTYATLRSSEREGKSSRLQQILDWLGPDYDGVIVFDEAHAMANAASSGGARGEKSASQQGLAGLRLQHALPHARVVYVSATGATTVENLAYAQRLGLWGNADLPFETRQAFVAAMQAGGIAANEVLARDLKAMGLYLARSLSYEGVEVDILEHTLTPAQTTIYDAYAHAYQIIHSNLTAALQATNITGAQGTLNAVAKSAVRAAFESNKQRFFNHLITAMKVPSLLASIETDLKQGHAAVVQLVSTSEALLERRLADIPPSEWNDLSFDVTPREYVLDYLKHSFPTQLYETYTDDDGKLQSRPVFVDGHIVECREAVARRDALIEQLAALPPVQSALDQIIHHFGADKVAEVTGRTRRIVKETVAGQPVLKVQNRPPTSNLGETSAFMDDVKPILVFSDAGGTGRSYHADLAARNQRLRKHYLLEAGWKADAAIQGLGRSNRTNQKQPPVFRPVATDVRGEKRFLSTIASRLDSLGAITRGQRQTGGQGMFRPSDNLESPYARSALRQFYQLLHAGKVDCVSLQQFVDMTGLALCDRDGTLREDLPPISTFLNRLLALPIARQNAIFAVFEDLVAGRVEAAISSGTYDIGLETIRADSLRISNRVQVATHAGTGAVTSLLTVEREDPVRPRTLADIQELYAKRGVVFLQNRQSGRVALQVPAPSLTLDDGTVEARVRLLRPTETQGFALHALSDTAWVACSREVFEAAWRAEVDALPGHVRSTFYVMTGLLLPLWTRLPTDSLRVYRFTTDDGEPVIGRLIPPDVVGSFLSAPDQITAQGAWDALNAGRSVNLGALTLRRVTVMHAPRFELVGFGPEQVAALKAMGLFSELIAWKLRLFVPTGEGGRDVVGALLARYGLRERV